MPEYFAGTPSEILRDIAVFERNPSSGSVRVPCNGCTRCCTSDFPVRLYGDERERFEHEPDPRDVAGEHVLLKKIDRVCVYLIDNKCSVYNERPLECRAYDCRDQYLAGLRNNAPGPGWEINERIDQWRTRLDGDLDRGIAAIMWITGHDAILQGFDVGRAVMLALIETDKYTPKEMKKIGRRYAKQVDEIVARALNAPSTVPHRTPTEENDHHASAMERERNEGSSAADA